MTNFERFITENPNHPMVVRLVKIADRMAMNGSVGKAYADLDRLANQTYA